MAQDTTPAIVVYQGDGTNHPFSIPFDKGYYGEVEVLFVRRGLADYTYYPDTYVVNGRLYAWAYGNARVFTHTPRPTIGAVVYTDEDIAPVIAITVKDLSNVETIYARSQADDVLVRRLYAWSDGEHIIYTNTPTPTTATILTDAQWHELQLRIVGITNITVSAIAGQTITVDDVVYTRAVQHDIANSLSLTWTGDTLEVGDFICIIRNTERGQPYEMPTNQKHIEFALDNLERQIQEVKDATDSALRIDPSYDIQDSHKMNPIEWLNTIVRSMDMSIRAFRYEDGWLDYSLEDPNIADVQKHWTHLVNTTNVKNFRHEVKFNANNDELHYLYYTDAGGEEHLISLPMSLIEKAIEDATAALEATEALDRRVTKNEEDIASIVSGVTIDDITIVENEDDLWEVQAVRNQNTAVNTIQPIYDWVGTQAEYIAQDVGTNHPDWLCFITDDAYDPESTYIFDQGTAASTWNITHNLNKYPSVTVVDSAGTKVECGITYINSNECQLKFNSAFKGKAYLN